MLMELKYQLYVDECISIKNFIHEIFLDTFGFIYNML